MLVLRSKNNPDKKLLLILISLFIALSLPAYVYLKFIFEDTTEKRLTELLNSDKVKKIEGRITNFKRKVAYPRNGESTSESFDIDSLHFYYIDNGLYEFHHFGGNHSNVLHNGLKVKITYGQGDKFVEILKLEIAKQNTYQINP
ncbi:hypothetical protein CEY12_19525 [Chryseobacterium sp. T16E-39]|nr:hypothetical protein CEY12_19525 [Chryseobacterium sp. T16E-39]